MSLRKAKFTLEYEIPGKNFEPKRDHQIPSKAGVLYHQAEIAVGEHPHFPQLRASTWVLRISGTDGSATLLPPLTLRAQKSYSFVHQLWGSAAGSEIVFRESESRTILSYDQPLYDPLNWCLPSSCDKHFNVTGHNWKLCITFDCGSSGSTLVPRVCLAEKISKLYDNGSFCDFKLVSSDGKEFPVHQTILAAWSPVFGTMFTTAMKEKESGMCRLQNCEGKAVNALLQFMYERPLPDMDDIVEDVLGLAEQYNIPELRTAYEEFLAKKIKADNVPKYLHLAKLYGMVGLKAKVVRFITEHANQI